MEHLHRYIQLEDTAEYKTEYCQICKKKLVSKKGKRGRIDHRRYYMEHLRNFLQRGSKLYARYYSTNTEYVKRNSED
jgi:hypothetical protein